jgi:hypothetical protein
MSDLGPIVEGFIAGRQFRQQQELAPLIMQETRQKVEDNALTIQEKEIKVQEARRMLSQQDALNKILAGKASQQSGATALDHASTQAGSMANSLYEIAQAELQVGRPEQAATHMKEAVDLAEKDSKIQTEFAGRNEKIWHDVGGLLGQAHDKSGWDRAKMIFQSMHPDQMKDPNVSKLMQMDYSPDLVKSLQDTVQSELQKSEIAKNKATAGHAYAAEREADFRTNVLLPKQVELDNARIGNLTKAGASKLAPKPTDVNEIVKLITPDFPAADPVVLYNLARSVAQTALYYEKVKGRSRPDAQDLAVQEAIQNRHFAGIPKRGDKKLGSTPANPLPMPEIPKDLSGDERAQWIKKNFRINQFYATSSPKLPGGIGVWNGEGFDPPEDDSPSKPDDGETE